MYKKIILPFTCIFVLSLFLGQTQQILNANEAIETEEVSTNNNDTIPLTEESETNTIDEETSENIIDDLSETSANDTSSEDTPTFNATAAVILPAPINEAFPEPKIAEAIAVSVYSNAAHVTKTVTQAQLNNIRTLTISKLPAKTIDLSQLIAYGGFPNLTTLTINGSGNGTIIDSLNNIDDVYFPKITSLTLSTIGNTTIPNFNLPLLTELQLQYMHLLTELEDYSNLPSLERIHVQYLNALTTIADFSHIPNLKYLTLTSLPSLKAIPDFQYLPNLTMLSTLYTFLDESLNFSHLPNLTSLSHSSAGELPDYDSIPNLVSLSVYGGQFTKIPDFSNLPLLNYAYFWTSAVTLEIPDFQHLPNMATMTIRGLNDGTTTSTTNTVPDFSSMPSMTGLAITEVPNFSGMPIMKYLSINNTKLLAVPDFDSMPILETLSLSQGNLSAVPNFGFIPNLTDLTLSNNKIAVIPDFDNLLKLNKLYINQNLLSSLPDSNMPELTVLYASDNKLTTLPELTYMKKLNQLVLTSNYLTTIPNLDLPLLTTLTLDKNRLTSLPELNLLPKMTSFTVATNALTELPTRVLNFSLSQLTPQSISLTMQVEAGDDITTDFPIIDQIYAKVPGLTLKSATIDNKAITITDPLGANMTIPTNNLNSGNHRIALNITNGSTTSLIYIAYNIQVTDTTVPVISSDTDITYEVNTPLPSTTEFIAALNASALDSVDGNIVPTADLSSVNMDVLGDYTVTLIATDTSNNTATKNVQVHIVDTTPPVITADNEVNYVLGSQKPTETEFIQAINASAQDSFEGPVSITTDLSSLNMLIADDYTIILSASDSSGNTSTKSIIVHITNAPLPIIQADSEITFEAGTSLLSETDFLTAVNASATNATVLSVDLTAINMNVVGTYTATISATNISNNTVTFDVTVHVVDTIAPVLTNDSTITYEAGSPLPTLDEFITSINAQAIDNIDGIIIPTADLSSIRMDTPNVYSINLSATDNSNNTTTHVVTIYIVDTTAPVLTTDSEVTLEAGTSLPTNRDFLELIQATAIDSVDGTLIPNIDLSLVNMNILGDYTVTLTATDNSGNISTMPIIVHVLDTLAPVITTQAEVTYMIDLTKPSSSQFLEAAAAHAVDSFEGDIALIPDLSSLDMGTLGDYTVTLFASDSSGNMASAAVIVHIVDSPFPIITADTDISYEAGLEKPTDEVFLHTVNAIGTNQVQSTPSIILSVDLTLINMNKVGNYTAVISATNEFNKTTTFTVNVHIIDTTPPTLTGDDEVTYKKGTALPSEMDFISTINAHAIDNIDGILTPTVDFSSINMNVSGDYIVPITATDYSKNKTTLNVLVHIIDTGDTTDNNKDNQDGLENTLPTTGKYIIEITVFSSFLLLLSIAILAIKKKYHYNK